MMRVVASLRLRIRDRHDFWAGLLFIAIGAAALGAALDYPFGTSRSIGPGYFPRLLGGVLILLGAAIAAKGLALEPAPDEGWAIRPLILVSAAVVVFAVALRPWGLAAATLLLVAISALAEGRFQALRVAALAAALIALCAAVFIYLLGLPLSLGPS
jgi:hypothetical protein